MYLFQLLFTFHTTSGIHIVTIGNTTWLVLWWNLNYRGQSWKNRDLEKNGIIECCILGKLATNHGNTVIPVVTKQPECRWVRLWSLLICLSTPPPPSLSLGTEQNKMLCGYSMCTIMPAKIPSSWKGLGLIKSLAFLCLGQYFWDGYIWAFGIRLRPHEPWIWIS